MTLFIIGILFISLIPANLVAQETQEAFPERTNPSTQPFTTGSSTAVTSVQYTQPSCSEPWTRSSTMSACPISR